MNATNDPAKQATSASSPLRRIAATVVVSGLIFVLLWVMAFNVLTSLLVASGICVVAVGASSVSDVVALVLDLVATVIFGVIGAIAAIFAAIVGVFGS